MRISTLERTLAALVRKASAPCHLEALRDLAQGESPIGFELASAAATLAARLEQTRLAADTEDVEKPWM